MSVSPVIALRKAIRAYLLADAGFAAAFGQKLYDEAPHGTEPPYALFGEAQLRDWSADLSPGAEQLFTIGVTSTTRGLSEALELAQRIADLIDESPLNLQDHRLIDLRFLSMETRREQNGRFARVNLRFRATTEYL
ncbi:DUF3168 domain-containing protein [Methylocystis sp. H62]|uniref:DUF3168 domain-containing protein n=1 Tax=Methylocystis sp. H62 TaxID=2785789 RepID=UPI0018C212A2|nr:DUF3168 domain-containing protein [Methylocystis sp. H62]MBG0794385.1 DUF3168 domain-containing protein [Methylocystis sp. H62]